MSGSRSFPTGEALEDGHVGVINGRGVTSVPQVVSAPGTFPKDNDFTSGVAWLPGNKHLLLYNTNNGIYMTSTRKRGSRRLNSAEGFPAVPSPDGTEFLFVPYTSSGNHAVYIQKINGSAHQLTQARKG